MIASVAVFARIRLPIAKHLFISFVKNEK